MRRLARPFWLAAGLAAVATGTMGIFLPLLPTVPFYILAAFCFARSHPAWEARLLAHPRYGHHLRAWRERGAVSRRGKLAAVITMAVSSVLSLVLIAWPWNVAPALACLASGTWLWRRPE